MASDSINKGGMAPDGAGELPARPQHTGFQQMQLKRHHQKQEQLVRHSHKNQLHQLLQQHKEQLRWLHQEHQEQLRQLHKQHQHQIRQDEETSRRHWEQGQPFEKRCEPRASQVSEDELFQQKTNEMNEERRSQEAGHALPREAEQVEPIALSPILAEIERKNATLLGDGRTAPILDFGKIHEASTTRNATLSNEAMAATNQPYESGGSSGKAPPVVSFAGSASPSGGKRTTNAPQQTPNEPLNPLKAAKPVSAATVDPFKSPGLVNSVKPSESSQPFKSSDSFNSTNSTEPGNTVKSGNKRGGEKKGAKRGGYGHSASGRGRGNPLGPRNNTYRVRGRGQRPGDLKILEHAISEVERTKARLRAMLRS